MLLCSAFGKLATAQLSLGLQLNFQPDPDPRQWADQDGLLIVTTVNNTNEDVECKYRCKLLLNGEIIIENSLSKMPTERIGAFETRISDVQDVLPISALSVYGDIKKTYLRANQIPAGNYLICAQLISPNGSKELSPEACVPMLITSYQQPSLVFPVQYTNVPAAAPPVFAWTPVTPPPPFPVEYRLRVMEVPADHTMKDDLVPTYRLQPGSSPDAAVYVLLDKKGKPYDLPLRSYQSATTALPEVANNNTQNKNSDRSNKSSCCSMLWPGSNDLNGQAANQRRAAAQPPSTAVLQAFNYGFPLVDQSLTNQTQAIWPPDVEGPLPGHTYVWSVQALREDGLPLGDNGGTALPEVFVVPEELGGANAWQAIGDGDIIVLPIRVVYYKGCDFGIFDDGSVSLLGCYALADNGGDSPAQLLISQQGGLATSKDDTPKSWLPTDAERRTSKGQAASSSILVSVQHSFTIENGQKQVNIYSDGQWDCTDKSKDKGKTLAEAGNPATSSPSPAMAKELGNTTAITPTTGLGKKIVWVPVQEPALVSSCFDRNGFLGDAENCGACPVGTDECWTKVGIVKGVESKENPGPLQALPLDKVKLAAIVKAAAGKNETTVGVCQSPSGEMTRMNDPSGCPLGSYFLEFEVGRSGE